MSQTAEQVISTIQHLPPNEQVRVWDWLREHPPQIDNRISNDEEFKARLFEQLMKDGLLSEVAPGLTDEEYDETQPIEIEGEPLSETIIRERR